MPGRIFQEGTRLQVTREEQAAIAKFLDALVPGLSFVKCYDERCGKFVSGFDARSVNIPHPTETLTRMLVYYCKDCADA